MRQRSPGGKALQWAIRGVGVGAAAYAAASARAWWRFGYPPAPPDSERDIILDRFLPTYDIVERHSVSVRAPAGVTLRAAADHELFGLPLVRAIFKARELAMGGSPREGPVPAALLPWAHTLGWRVLAEVPDHEIVLGAITQPWEANVRFQGLPPAGFASFWEPGYVKIAWTLRADAVGSDRSMFRTETRAVATDDDAADRFRRYWTLAAPGVSAVRWLALRGVRRAAESRARTLSQPEPDLS